MHDHLAALVRESLALVDVVDRDPLLGRIVRGDASRAQYLCFLQSTYHYVRWSGPLLAETAAGLRRHGGASWLVELLDDKTREESPHDRWVLDDLQRLGANTELLKVAAQPHAVTAYVELARSLAEAGSPGYLGAAYALELISARRAKLAATNLRGQGCIAGIEKGLSFLEGHGDADEGHVARLEGILGRLEAVRDQEDVCLTARHLCRLYPRFFTSVGAA